MADDFGFGFKPGFANPSAPPTMYPGSNYPPPPGSGYPPGAYPPPPHSYPPGSYPPGGFPPSCPPGSHYPSPPSPHYPPPPSSHCPPPPSTHYPHPPSTHYPHPPSSHFPAPPFQPPMVHPSHPPTYPPHSGGNIITGGHKAYYWLDWSAERMVPPTAVHGGVDKDGSQIYVGRAFHGGDWIPAKVIPERHTAYVAFEGVEHTKDEFQLLCEQRFDWVPTSGSNIPPGAVEGGRTGSGEPLYVGRVWHDGAHTVGKVHPSHGTCYIPYAGQEMAFADYEILVLRV